MGEQSSYLAEYHTQFMTAFIVAIAWLTLSLFIISLINRGRDDDKKDSSIYIPATILAFSSGTAFAFLSMGNEVYINGMSIAMAGLWVFLVPIFVVFPSWLLYKLCTSDGN